MTLNNRVPYFLIFSVPAALLAIYNSDVVWTWVNIDEEEDTVRFRQRLAFAIFWLLSLGMVQVKRIVET